ncbi:BLUF domain-containing protein [Caulobacter sp. ErkDOM-YI]|uniref:BLUF domain-containing protein n=1 Tax=unclassified Caulobacter TaxID=2648921 RepID=UPI003AF755BB
MEGHLIDLLYVSRSRLTLAQGTDQIADIVRVSLERNAALGVTGALVWTGEAFAQILEGPDAALEVLMASIARDERHETLSVLRRGAIQHRRFAGWALAYAGGASFIAGLVEPLLAPSVIASDPAVDKLIRALHAFA